MISFIFKKRDDKIRRLKKEIEELKEENSDMYQDIVVLIGDDKKTKYHIVKQKWRTIVDIENSLWNGDVHSIGKGILNQIKSKVDK